MSHQSWFKDTHKLQYELNYVIKWSLKSLTRPLVCISTLPISYRFISIFDNIDNLIVHPKYSLISLKSSKLCIRYLNVYIEITPFCAKVNWLDLLDIWDGLEFFENMRNVNLKGRRINQKGGICAHVTHKMFYFSSINYFVSHATTY